MKKWLIIMNIVTFSLIEKMITFKHTKIGVGGKTGVFRNYQPHCLLSVNFDTWANFFGASFQN